jgi:magnesium-protoporphyrin IX monomethyl ester (oxidative) cyclase
MRILLIYPTYPIDVGLGVTIKLPPLQLTQLAAMIPNQKVELLDLNAKLDLSFDSTEDIISKSDLVGISCTSIAFGQALKLCELAKRHNVPTILGGFHPTLKPDIIKYGDIDYLIRGEGEYAFKEFVEGEDPTKILGLSYKENGIYHHNELRPLISNLDMLPLPRKDLLNYEKYHVFGLPADAIETSRGCPFSCNFCAVSKFYGRTYRKKSPERIIKELESIPKKQVCVFITDDNFTLDQKRVKKTCELIREHQLHKKLMFTCQARADDIARNPELVKEMAQSKFFTIFIGFESLKQESLELIAKGVNLPLYKKAVEICHDNKLKVFGSFIIGNIGETKEDLLKLPDLVKELGIDIALAGPPIPFPATELWDQAMKNGWLDADFDWATYDISRPQMRTNELSREEIKEMIDNFYHSFYRSHALNGTFKRLPFHNKQTLK